MIRLIASDLDETLLNTDTHVDAYTIEQIQKVQEKGAYFVCATGRNYVSIQKTLKEIGTYQKEDTYTLSLNGSVVTENKDNKVLFCTSMPFEVVESLFHYGLQHEVCIHVYTIDQVYTWHLNQGERDFLEGRAQVIECEQENISFLKEKPLIKILFENEDFEYLRNIESRLDEDVRKVVDISYSSNRYLEFNQLGINKGEGLRFLSQYLQIPLEETMAIGDNFNDKSMLQVAGLGVGVKNLHPDLTSYVDVVLDYTHNEDAVGHALEKYVL